VDIGNDPVGDLASAHYRDTRHRRTVVSAPRGLSDFSNSQSTPKPSYIDLKADSA
jgi:hypothetical protein